MKYAPLLAFAACCAASGAASAHDMSPKAPNIKGTHYHLSLPADWVNHNRFAITPMYSQLSDSKGDTQDGFGLHLNLAKQLGSRATSPIFDIEAKQTHQKDGTNTKLETTRAAAYLGFPFALSPSLHVTPKIGGEFLSTKTSTGGSAKSDSDPAIALSLDGRAAKNADYQIQAGSTKTNMNLKLQLRFNVGSNFKHAITTTFLAEEYGPANSLSFGIGYQLNLAR